MFKQTTNNKKTNRIHPDISSDTSRNDLNDLYSDILYQEVCKYQNTQESLKTRLNHFKAEPLGFACLNKHAYLRRKSRMLLERYFDLE